MAPKKPKRPQQRPAWVATAAAPAKVKVPKVTDLNKLTSSDWKGIVATVDERIEWCQFETLVTKNFSSWEDVRKHLGVDPEVIVRLQDRLAEHPSVLKWVQKPGEFASEPSQPDILPPESATKSGISKRKQEQGLDDTLLEKHKDKKHAAYEAMRDLQVQISRVRASTHTVVSPSTAWCDMAAKSAPPRVLGEIFVAENRRQ